MNDEFFEKLEPLSSPHSRPVIPSSVYKPAKRCPSCKSVYLTDTSCEDCGRSLLYHPVGEPFSSKSLYGFKERYYVTFPLFMKFFPFFEDKRGAAAKFYSRQLMKRFEDLINAFGIENTIELKNRRYFYVEIMELMDELLRYGVDSNILKQKIENNILDTGAMLTQELLLYLNESKKDNYLTRPRGQLVLEYRIGGMRVNYILKAVMITATVLSIAVNYYGVISSQFGK